MPEVSEFFGIAIYFYYREHAPPHFHAVHGGEQVRVAIDGLSTLRGRISPRALGLVIEWASQHVDDLRRAWAQAAANLRPDFIEPLT
jgi:hypothetical protein